MITHCYWKAFILVLFLTVLWMTFRSELALAQPQESAAAGHDEAMIAFDEVPATLGHTSNTCKRAWTLKGPIEIGNQIWKEYGSHFATWLRDGHRAIINRIELAPGSCPAVSACACEPAYDHVYMVPFLVDMRTHEVLLKITKNFVNSNTIYASASPVYADDKSTEVVGWLVGVQGRGPDINTMQSYRVNADGSNPEPVPTPEMAKAHGCQMSPDKLHLACEVPAISPSPRDSRFCLTDLGGSACTYVQKDNELMTMAVAHWSPDSRGFAYYSEDNERVRLMYYQLGGTPVELGPPWTSTARWTPSGGCNYRFPCKPYGGLGSEIGSELLEWSKTGNYLYFSAVNLAEEAPLHRYLVRIPIGRPDSIEVLTPNFEGEPGHPVLSPDESELIFTSPASPFDPEAQMFRVSVKEKKPVQLTHLPPGWQAYAPSWGQ